MGLFSSKLTLSTTMSSCCSAISTTLGKRARHAPHQVAKKSTMTNFSPASASASTNSCVEWMSFMLGGQFFSHHLSLVVSLARTTCVCLARPFPFVQTDAYEEDVAVVVVVDVDDLHGWSFFPFRCVHATGRVASAMLVPLVVLVGPVLPSHLYPLRSSRLVST